MTSTSTGTATGTGVGRPSPTAWTPAPIHDPQPAALRPLLTFAAVALPVGWAILTPAILLGLPQEPFVMATLLLALVAPALVITARRSGGAGLRALLRDAVRLPRPLWWVAPAALVLPVTVWLTASTAGVARPLTTALVTDYLVAFLSSVLIINIWEETVWAGFVQRRAMARWGTISGSTITALLFVGIHLPLALGGATGPRSFAVAVLSMLAAGVGLRLIIAAMDSWTAGSLLSIGILHGSFNATYDLVEPAYDWIRLTAAVVLGVVAVTVLLRARRAR